MRLFPLVLIAAWPAIAMGQPGYWEQSLPPYITSGAPRPLIAAAPAYMHYDELYTITYNANGGPQATQACLIRLAATTHGFDQDQRRVPLEIVPLEPTEDPMSRLRVLAPPNANHAPPGFYMLFILNEYATGQYAPCQMAAYVQVGP